MVLLGGNRQPEKVTFRLGQGVEVFRTGDRFIPQKTSEAVCLGLLALMHLMINP